MTLLINSKLKWHIITQLLVDVMNPEQVIDHKL
jgi:hypothetical protein